MIRLLAIALVALSACGPSAPAYPTEFEANFKASCLANPAANSGFCDCVWQRIETEIPVEEFIGFDAAVTNGQPHPAQAKIERFAQQCLSHG